MIIDPSTIDTDLTLDADVCVIGSGAGGAVAAKELAEAGRSVIVLEEGPYSTSGDFTQRETEMYQRLFDEQASRGTSDLSVLVLRGRTVGGSMVPGFCLCFRPPAAVLDNWRTGHGLSRTGAQAMAPYFARVEEFLGVRRMVDADLNANNARFRLGAEQLGLRGAIPMHNRVDCLGCGYCMLGCSYDRKTGPLTGYLPAASRAGAVLLPGCRAEQIETSGGRATGVRSIVSGGAGVNRIVRVRARTVVLAAGAIASPQLWLRSRLPNTHGQVGRNLHLHPQVVVAAVFDEEIRGWEGIPQSYVVDQFLRPTGKNNGGYLLFPTFAFPVACASLLPGFGSDHRRLMESYSRMAMTAVVLHDSTAGRIELSSDAQPVVNYHLNEDDRADLMDGMRRAADIHFAAGAGRVILPYNETVEIAKRGDYRAIDERGVRTNDPLLFSYQPQGTLRMGSDPARSVVDERGEAHEVRNLYVADASVFPTSVAVPPALSVLAFATRTAEHISRRMKER